MFHVDPAEGWNAGPSLWRFYLKKAAPGESRGEQRPIMTLESCMSDTVMKKRESRSDGSRRSKDFRLTAWPLFEGDEDHQMWPRSFIFPLFLWR